MSRRRHIVPPRIAVLLIVAASLAGAGGCAGALSKPYPAKSLHALEVGPPPEAGALAAPSAAVLRVDRVRVAAPYDATTFVYKVGPTRFESDYYNGFIAEPGRLLTEQLSDWMCGSKVFACAVGGGSGAAYQLALETNVTALYGDYSEKDKPRAVVEARFFLIDQTGGQFNIVFEKRYRESRDIAAASPEALVGGWDDGWRRILTALVEDLRQQSRGGGTKTAAAAGQ